MNNDTFYFFAELPSIEHIRDFFQIIYFFTLSLVALLTFSKARKTLLQPLRTEIFKEQLKNFNATLDLFVGKNEFELRQDYGLDILFESNIGYLMIGNSQYTDIIDDYLSEILSKNNIVRLSNSNQIISNSREFNVENKIEFSNLKIYIEELSSKEKREKPGSCFDVFILLSINYYTNKKKLLIIRNSPVIPNDMLELFDKFLSTVEENFDIATEILNQYSLELQDLAQQKQYTKDEFLTLANQFSRKMEKDYVKKQIKLEPKTIDIINYIRSYFNPDRLFD